MNKEIKHQDTYFFDAQLALKIAKEQNRVYTVGTITGLQVCYYGGDFSLKDAPKNCIFVPLENFYNYFVKTENRVPDKFDFYNSPVEDSEIDDFRALLKETYKAISKEHKSLIQVYKQECKKLTVDFSDKKLRIYFTVSRDTTVLKYVTQYISNIMKERDYEVYFHMPNEMGAYFTLPILVKYHEFNPHITFNINYLNNEYLNDDVINFVWFQDPMPDLLDDSKVVTRDKDVLLSLSHQIMEKKFLKKDYYIQKSCVDSKDFYLDSSIRRENKIVFIGSKYLDNYFGLSKDNGKKLENLFRIMLNEKKEITKDLILKYSKEYECDFNNILYGPLTFVVREVSVEWLCQQTEINVEIYGRYWESNKIVAPFFKGELLHKDLVKVYNSAKYALSSHPGEMYLTRIGEMSACGVIPIIYDARNFDQCEFLHETSSLIFSTYDELVSCLSKTPKNDVKQISEYMSYSKLVDTIEERLKKELNK